MEYINVHTHKRGDGIYILDASDGKEIRRGELRSWGIHPVLMEGEETLPKLERMAKEGILVALGEAGLDRNSKTDITLQMKWFEQEALIAEDCDLPLIIHCVRAYPELINIYRKIQPKKAWIVHGYNGNGIILRELLKYGLYISVGEKIFVKHSNIRLLLPEISLEKLFIETDDSDYSIEEIYTEVSLLLNIELEELKNIVYTNFRYCFGK